MIVFLVTLHVLVCVMLIVLVLVQRGKGAEIGAVFGGGASTTVFGSRGAGNFLTRLTTIGAVIFMLTSLSLSYLATTGASRSIFEDEGAPPPAAGEATPEAGGFQEVPAAAGGTAGQAAGSGGEVPAPATGEAPEAPAPPAGGAAAEPDTAPSP